ncbi:peptidylprolyl isomerase [Sphingobacteriaceae bacterium]|nr:peptidylprolyl isomerase [Sphingobacteriaceae bacterium]
MRDFTLLLFLSALIFLPAACENHPKEIPHQQDNAATDKQIREQFIRANQQLAQKENDEMDYYAKSHKMAFVRTKSGIRYFVYKPSVKGDSIRDGMTVGLDFDIKLLDGTLCYSSKTEGRKTIVIGHDDVESGIHHGLQYLKSGDKALLLIPSPLAHGLLGDFKKIPPQMPILCDVAIY